MYPLFSTIANGTVQIFEAAIFMAAATSVHAPPQEAAHCATRQPHAQGYRRRTRLHHLDVMEWSAGSGARWLPTTIQDVASRRADVANNLSRTRPLLIQKQTKPSASGDR